jgi:tRNA-dependent cyclodipeptide synthase
VCPKQEQKQKFKITGFEPIWKSQSKTNSLIIGVSVGSQSFEGIGLNTLVNAINTQSKKVTHCTIAVCDTLQRHNYRLDGKTSEEAAHTMSKIAGNQWIERNTSVLKKLKIPYQTTRWDEWLNDSRYADAFSEISNLFDKDFEFKEAVEYSIKTFSSRFRKRHEELGFSEGGIDPAALVQSCRAYLLEECAIIMKLWPINKNDHCEFILYPGKMTKALAYTYEKFVVEKNLFKWNKFVLKKTISLSQSNAALFDFQDKVALTSPVNEQEKYFFLSVLAGCTSIMTALSNASKAEKIEMLSSFTKASFFQRPYVNDTFESTSNEKIFLQK